ncbi:mannose-P-dolichol utilization defect 1 protein homolog [Anabrus simplex]|uniref:mannose-P-dolichol utilization defect 1 protein homolog n=1 Tax=Anabrus simplex TaxID=316456 RepID=UPI0034DD4EEA
MAALFRNLVLFLLTPECYDEFFVEFHFLHVPCLKAAISKGLGLGIIAGSVMVKVPQITKILNSKSAEGISILSVLLDLFAITSSVAYSFVKGFPFSAWGEGLFLAVQTAIIATLVLLYGGSLVRAVGFVISYVILLFVLLSGFTPVDMLWSMQAVNVPIIITGKLIQVVTNYRNGSTGQLSAATGFMLFFGSLARIFTSIQETGDTIIIVTYVSACSVNAIIAGQLVYYWNVVHNNKKKD